MSNFKQLNDEELSIVSGGKETCVFDNGRIMEFEIGHYYHKKGKDYIIKIVGSFVSEINNRYSCPVEIYSLDKTFIAYGGMQVHEDDAEYEEVTNF